MPDHLSLFFGVLTAGPSRLGMSTLHSALMLLIFPHLPPLVTTVVHNNTEHGEGQGNSRGNGREGRGWSQV